MSEQKAKETMNESMELLSAEEAAEYLKFSTKYIYTLAKENRIPHACYGRHLIFRKVDLFNWVGSMVSFKPEKKEDVKWI